MRIDRCEFSPSDNHGGAITRPPNVTSFTWSRQATDQSTGAVGSMFHVASMCRCVFGFGWVCENDGGSYPLGACDAGADGPDADRQPDATTDDADDASID